MAGAHFLSLFFPLQIIWVLLVIYGIVWELRGAWPFFMGFIALFLLWSLYAYGLDWNNQHILADKIGDLLGMEGWMVPLLTGLVGGLMGGVCIWLGNNLRRWLIP